MSPDKNLETALKTFKSWKIYLAVALGLSVSCWQFCKSLHGQSLTEMIYQISHPNWCWLFAALIVLIIRDLGYMFRIRHLTNQELSWKSSFYTIILWEFASAITPSVVGGTAFAIFILKKEGIKMGKSIAYVSLTAILDNSFFIVAAPIGMLLAKDHAFFSEPRNFLGFGITLSSIFFISYLLIAIYTIIMALGVLVNPKIFQKMIIGIVKLFPFTEKARRRAYRLTIDNIIAADEIKHFDKKYWVKAISSTIFVWTARYFMLNCLLAAFFPWGIIEHQEAFGKQLVLWVTQLISPTPGASGIVEIFMREFFGKALIISAITLLWRSMTYYAYLGLGAIFLPRWIQAKFGKAS